MGYIIYLCVMILFGITISKMATALTTSTRDSSNDLVRLDDKNWIINNKFVSFEEDTPVLRFKQEREDTKHYRHYESHRLNTDRSRIGDDYLKTIFAIQDHPDLKDCVTEEKLLEITEKHEEYVYMCTKLKEDIMVLSKEEFLIKQENPIYCATFKIDILNPLGVGFYTIHNEKTAKYANGNVNELIEAEFKEKWY